MNLGNWNAVDVAACSSREDWLRKFLTANPNVSAGVVGFAYAASRLHERFGSPSMAEIEAMQKELGVGEPAEEAAASQAAVRAGIRARKAARERYIVMDHTALAALDDEALAAAALARAVHKVGRGADDAKAKLSSPMWDVWTAFYLDADVRNGGFDQYFRNSCGDDVDDAIAAFHRMGATSHADISARATACLRERYAVGPIPQNAKLPDLSKFDQEYFAIYPRGRLGLTQNLSRLVLAPYLRANIDAV